MLRNHCIKFGLVALTVSLAIVANAFAEEKEGKEEKVSLKDCPAAVQKTIKGKAADAKIEEIEKQTTDSKVVYEVDIEKDGKDQTFRVAEDGQFLGWVDEEKDESKEHDGKDKDDKD